MSSMSGDIKLPSTAGQTPVDFWLDSSAQESSGAAAAGSSQREMPTGLEANFTGSLPDSSWPDHDHVHGTHLFQSPSLMLYRMSKLSLASQNVIMKWSRWLDLHSFL